MNVKKLSEIVDLQKGKKPEISSKSDGNLPYLTAKYIRGEADPEYGIPDSEGSVVVSHEDYVIIMDGSNSGEVFTGLNGILASTMGKLVLKEKKTYKYESNGNRIQNTEKNSGGNFQQKTYKYEYYSKGNWIKRIDFKVTNEIEKTEYINEIKIECYYQNLEK